MELYSAAPQASIQMARDPLLNEKLTALITERKTDVIIESGTHIGTGSTRFIAEILLKTHLPRRFVTIEGNFQNWVHAKMNLRPFAFVEPRWGCSVEVETARKFIAADEMLANHQSYSGIFIDDIEDPVAFYTREVCDKAIFETQNSHANELAMLFDGENLLPRLLACHRDHNPLIVLDSAGGIGWMEFQLVLHVMGDRPYAILLDDVKHIKHFRSLLYIRNAAEFDLIAESEWALAVHRPK